MTQTRIVARLGASDSVPALLNGEIGYDVDTKTFRVGDDTPEPTKVMTDKGVGEYQYPNIDHVGFPAIRLLGSGTIENLQLGTIKYGSGLLVFQQYDLSNDLDLENTNEIAGRFVHRAIETDEYLRVDNADGQNGNIVLGVSERLIQLIGEGGGVKFSYGVEPPAEAKPGHMFWSTEESLLFIRLIDSETPDTGWWLDVASIGGGGGGGGSRTFVGDTPAITAQVGDYYLDTTDNYRRYLRTRDANGVYWREVLA